MLLDSVGTSFRNQIDIRMRLRFATIEAFWRLPIRPAQFVGMGELRYMGRSGFRLAYESRLDTRSTRSGVLPFRNQLHRITGVHRLMGHIQSYENMEKPHGVANLIVTGLVPHIRWNGRVSGIGLANDGEQDPTSYE